MEKDNLGKIGLYRLPAELESRPGDYLSLCIKPPSFPHHISGLSLQPQYSIYANEIEESVNVKGVAQAAEKYNTGAAIYWQRTATNI